MNKKDQLNLVTVVDLSSKRNAGLRNPKGGENNRKEHTTEGIH